MVVTVDQIRAGGLSLDETLSESFLTHALAEVKDTGFRPDGPALLHVKLQKTGSGVLLRGSVGNRLRDKVLDGMLDGLCRRAESGA